MEQILKAQKEFLRTDLPAFRVGDVIRVAQKDQIGGKERVATCEGIVIKIHKGKDLDSTFTIRWIASGKIGVEKTFPLHSPTIIKIEKIKENRVRRAKLYNLRNGDSLKLKTKVQKEKGGAKKKAGSGRGKSGQKISAEKGTKSSGK